MVFLGLMRSGATVVGGVSFTSVTALLAQSLSQQFESSCKTCRHCVPVDKSWYSGIFEPLIFLLVGAVTALIVLRLVRKDKGNCHHCSPGVRRITYTAERPVTQPAQVFSPVPVLQQPPPLSRWSLEPVAQTVDADSAVALPLSDTPTVRPKFRSQA